MKRRHVLWSAGVAVALMMAAVGGGILVLRSRWFLRQVRDKLVAVVETATGGRAEVGAIQFDWRNLRARVAPFTLHGSEPAGKPPLFQAASIGIGLKIVSLFRRDVDLQDLEVTEPRIYLIVNRDGSTNVPEPKTANRGALRARRPVVEHHSGRGGGAFSSGPRGLRSGGAGAPAFLGARAKPAGAVPL